MVRGVAQRCEMIRTAQVWGFAAISLPKSRFMPYALSRALCRLSGMEPGRFRSRKTMTRARSLIVAGGLFLATSVAAAAPGPTVIINEYLYDPANSAAGDANKDTVIDTSQDEFVEFVNVTNAPIDMSGWTLSDSVTIRHTFPGGSVVGPGCAIVVFGGGHPPINLFGGAVVQTASTGLLGLNNDGDTITLKDSAA